MIRCSYFHADLLPPSKFVTAFARKRLLCSQSPTVCIDFMAETGRWLHACLILPFWETSKSGRCQSFLLKPGSLLTAWIHLHLNSITYCVCCQRNHIFTRFFHNAMFHGRSGTLKENTPGGFSPPTAAKRYWPALPLPVIFY